LSFADPVAGNRWIVETAWDGDGAEAGEVTFQHQASGGGQTGDFLDQLRVDHVMTDDAEP
jgi:hypothetical protein